MKLSRLLLAAGLEKKWTDEMEIIAITNDSRKVIPGSLFVSTVTNPDRSKVYAQEAMARGALLVVTEREILGIPYVITDDPRKVYSFMLAEFYGQPQKKLKMIGITGTNGKTSTAWMLSWILTYAGIQTGVLGTVSNRLAGKTLPVNHTTPDSGELYPLLREMVDSGCTHCVMEVSSHGLAQKRVEGIDFDLGIFTNLTQDHLDYHHTMGAYLQAKKKLFAQSVMGIVNLDSPYCEGILADFHGQVVSYGLDRQEAVVVGKNPVYSLHSSEVMVEIGQDSAMLRLPIPGDYNLYNALAAISAAVQLGLNLDQAVEALGDFTGVSGRMETLYQGEFTVIRDYAHTPDALEKLLKAVRPLVEGRLVVLFGCGGDRDQGKRPLMGKTAQQNSDYVIITSDNPRSENVMKIIRNIKEGLTSSGKNTIIIPDRLMAIAYGLSFLREGDTLILAGKGHETVQILKDEKIPFDEKKIVSDMLSRR